MDEMQKVTATEFYSKCRSQIEHEDDLVNQRLSWLMTLQGFLFTAYGFSMSAEAASLSAVDSKGYPTFWNNLSAIRYGLVILGILSSLAALVGVLAAFRAIKDSEKSLADNFPRNEREKLFPRIIGNRTTNTMGITCGVAIPFLTSGVWVWIGNLQGVQYQIWIVVLALALFFTLLCLYWGFKQESGVFDILKGKQK